MKGEFVDVLVDLSVDVVVDGGFDVELYLDLCATFDEHLGQHGDDGVNGGDQVQEQVHVNAAVNDDVHQDDNVDVNGRPTIQKQSGFMQSGRQVQMPSMKGQQQGALGSAC